MNPSLVLAVLLSLPHYTGDRSDTPEERAALLGPVASAIAAAAKNEREAAVLVTLGFHESAFARYVVEGRCKDGPPGAQCDGGLARGPWQVHSWCRPLWTAQDGSSEALHAGALCAVRLTRTAYVKCGRTWEGLFSGYRRLDRCKWSGAKRRVSTLGLVQGRFAREARR